MRQRRISVDEVENGYFVLYLMWNNERSQWEEYKAECYQSKEIMFEVLKEYFTRQEDNICQ